MMSGTKKEAAEDRARKDLDSPPKLVRPTETASEQVKIRYLNDVARTALGVGGRLMLTHGVSSMPPDVQSGLREALEKFDHWDEDNDPYGTHEFGTLWGCFEQNDSVRWTSETPADIDKFFGHKVFFRIDIFDVSYQHGAEEPWNPKTSRRVVTLMLANEY